MNINPLFMADFETTLAKQKARHTALTSTSPALQRSQTNFASLQPALRLPKRPVFSESVKSTAPQQPEQSPSHRYPIDKIENSNHILKKSGFSFTRMTMGQFQSLAPKSLQLYSDGVYRMVEHHKGVVSHVPVFVVSSPF